MNRKPLGNVDLFKPVSLFFGSLPLLSDCPVVADILLAIAAARQKHLLYSPLILVRSTHYYSSYIAYVIRPDAGCTAGPQGPVNTLPCQLCFLHWSPSCPQPAQPTPRLEDTTTPAPADNAFLCNLCYGIRRLYPMPPAERLRHCFPK